MGCEINTENPKLQLLYEDYVKCRRWVGPRDTTSIIDRIKIAREYLLEMLKQQSVYRVELHQDNSIGIIAFSLAETFAPALDSAYNNFSELPNWAQRKLAVLMVIDPNKPPIPDLEGVGRRISQNVFWLYGDGDSYGNDTGSEGQAKS